MATSTDRTRVAVEVRAGNPVWRKAPTSLLRHRTLFAAVSIGAFLVVSSVAAYPLFLSASRDALVDSEIANPTVTRFGAGITYTASNVRFRTPSPDGHGPLFERRLSLYRETLARSPAVGPVVEQILGDEIALTPPGGRAPPSGPVSGVLFAGTDVLDSVDVLEGSDGPGVWLPDSIADPLGASPGDRIELHRGHAVVPVTVDGIYRALYKEPLPSYWRAWREQVYPCPGIDCSIPPQPILVDRAQLLQWATTLGDPRAAFALTAPVRAAPALTLDEARDLSRFAGELGARMTTGDSDFTKIFLCCGRLYGVFQGHSTDVEFLTATSGVVRVVDRRMAAVQGPLLVLLLAAIAISLAIVAAAGIFSFSARRVEAGALAVRGWGPMRIGVKAVLESAGPFLVGSVLGLLVASWTVAALGPGGSIEPSARSAAWTGAAIAAVGGLLLVGVVSALSFASRHERREGLARLLVFVPWEVFAIGGAWAMAGRLRSRGGVLGTGIERPAPAVFLFPLLLSLGIAILAARLLTVVLARRRRGGTARVTARYLAVRRLASSSKLAALFVVASSLALAVFAASQAMVASLRTTVEAKAEVFVGSDVEMRIGPDTVVPPDLGFPATIATRSQQAGRLHDSDIVFDLVVIDPATFEGAAYWNDAFSDRSLSALLDELGRPIPGRLPTVLANGTGLAPTALDIQQETVPIEIVGRASSVPGSSSDRPVFLVTQDQLAAAFEGKPDPLHEPQATREMWIRGPTDPVLSAASASGVGSYLTVTAAEVEDIPFIQAAIDTFLVLNVLGIVALILVLVVAVVYVQARQRSRIVASALSDRMGLDPVTTRRSLVLELAILLFVGLVVGVCGGLIGALVVTPYLDPLPTIPPDPITVLPKGIVAAAALVLVVAAVLGGRLATRATRRIALGEVLRVAE
jgi:putative ABC transport system permease protein